ncbi:MAG: hypothetical protein IPK16_31435 [Anaerolineales bacterium]|nr:hypothetical protein [Anaerolineales bacterium]
MVDRVRLDARLAAIVDTPGAELSGLAVIAVAGERTVYEHCTGGSGLTLAILRKHYPLRATPLSHRVHFKDRGDDWCHDVG